jgi:predicted dehydrogenase
MASVDRPVRLIVVGCGDIARQEHLPAIARSTGTELAGVVDPDDGATAGPAERFGVPSARGVAEAMAWRPDAAIVATPPEITAHLTLELVERGLHVLCEKPMAVDVESARAVHERAAVSDRIVQVGFVNRFSPVIARAREWVRGGLLGHPLVFALTTYDERYDPGDQAHFRRIMHFLEHGPAFVHEAAHQTDYVFHLGGGSVTGVSALSTATRPEFPAENHTAALVRYDNGNAARLEVGWMLPVLPPSDFRILGPLGAVRVSRKEGWAELTTADLQDRVELDRPWTEAAFDGQLAAFVSAVRAGEPRGPGTADGLASLRLCQEIVSASRSVMERS